jgi:hypothetical protein
MSIQTVLLVVGGIASVAGLLAGLQRVRTMLAGRAADGVVVENARGSTIHSQDGTASVMLEPVVEFVHDGRKLRFKSLTGTKQGLPVGQHVPVRYLPSDPQGTAEIATPLRMFGFPAVALVAGAVLLALGLWGPPAGS